INANGAAILGVNSPNASGFAVLIGGNYGGTVTNGNSTANTALNGGCDCVVFDYARGTVVNFGSIIGTASFGVRIQAPGVVENGKIGRASCRERGEIDGVNVTGSGKVSNFGTISASGTPGSGSAAIVLNGGGSVVNGS